MSQAYLLASANGTLPANARQIMYAARPLVLERTGGKCWEKSSYFTQTLLPDYVSEHADERPIGTSYTTPAAISSSPTSKRNWGWTRWRCAPT